MQTLRKKASPFKYKNDPSRFMGEGMNFKAKLIGILEVNEARGDRMCQEALSDLKMAIRAAGEHKQRIIINIGIDGLRLKDERNGDSLHHHPVHKISFIAQDTSDARAFGYIYGSPDIGHRFFGLKTEKAASIVVVAMRDLFQVVFELKKKEIELAKQSFSDHQKFRYGNLLPKFSDSIVSTAKNLTSNSKLLQIDNEYSRYSSMQTTDHSHSHHHNVSRTGSLSPSFAASSSLQPKSQSLLLLQSPVASASGTVGRKQQQAQPSNDEAIADLLDLELELNNIRQGIHQMEKMTPCDQYGSVTLSTTSSAGYSGRTSVSESIDSVGSNATLEDPFGDSFTKYYIPPPPQSNRSSTNRSHSSQRSCSNEATPKGPSPITTLTTRLANTELAAQNYLTDRKTPCDLKNSFSGSTAAEKMSAKTSQSSDFDIFAELDPLGTGKEKPYIDKKLFFNEIKNPPKMTLNFQQQQQQQHNRDRIFFTTRRNTNSPILETKSSDSRLKAAAVLSTLDDLYKKSIVLPTAQQQLPQLTALTAADPFDYANDPFLDLQKRPQQSTVTLLTSVSAVPTKIFDQTTVSVPPPRPPSMSKRSATVTNAKMNERNNSSLKSEIPPLPKPNRKVPSAKRTNPLGELLKPIEPQPTQQPPSLNQHHNQTEEEVRSVRLRNIAEISSVCSGHVKSNDNSDDEYLTPIDQQKEELVLNLKKLSDLSVKLNIPTNELANMTLSQLTDLLMKPQSQPQSQSNENKTAEQPNAKRCQAISVSDVFLPSTETIATIDRYSALRDIDPFDSSQATTITSCCSTFASETAYFEAKNELGCNDDVGERDNVDENGNGGDECDDESTTITKNSMTLTAGVSLSSFEDAVDIINEQELELELEQEQQRLDEDGDNGKLMEAAPGTDWADFESQKFEENELTIAESQGLSEDMARAHEDEESSSTTTTSASSGEQSRLCKSHKKKAKTKRNIEEEKEFREQERQPQHDDSSGNQQQHQQQLHECENKVKREIKTKKLCGGNQRHNHSKQRLPNCRGRWSKHDDDDEEDYDDGEVDYDDYEYDDGDDDGDDDEDDDDNDHETNPESLSDNKSSKSCHYEMLKDQKFNQLCRVKKRIPNRTFKIATTNSAPVKEYACCCSYSKKDVARQYRSKMDERYPTVASLKRERKYALKCCNLPDNCGNCGCSAAPVITSTCSRNNSRVRSRSRDAHFEDCRMTAATASGRRYVGPTTDVYCSDEAELTFGSKRSLIAIPSNTPARNSQSHSVDSCNSPVLGANRNDQFQHRSVTSGPTCDNLISAQSVSKTNVLHIGNAMHATSSAEYQENTKFSATANGFEDDFIPFMPQVQPHLQQSLPVPSETITGDSGISSIAEEVVVLDKEVQNNEQRLPEGTGSTMHKSESVNIFRNEQDPFDDTFFKQNFMTSFATTTTTTGSEQADAFSTFTAPIVTNTTSNISDSEWSKKFKTFDD